MISKITETPDIIMKSKNPDENSKNPDQSPMRGQQLSLDIIEMGDISDKQRELDQD